MHYFTALVMLQMFKYIYSKYSVHFNLKLILDLDLYPSTGLIEEERVISSFLPQRGIQCSLCQPDGGSPVVHNEASGRAEPAALSVIKHVFHSVMF